jgi:hypothetical protein
MAMTCTQNTLLVLDLYSHMLKSHILSPLSHVVKMLLSLQNELHSPERSLHGASSVFGWRRRLPDVEGSRITSCGQPTMGGPSAWVSASG